MLCAGKWCSSNTFWLMWLVYDSTYCRCFIRLYVGRLSVLKTQRVSRFNNTYFNSSFTYHYIINRKSLKLWFWFCGLLYCICNFAHVWPRYLRFIDRLIRGDVLYSIMINAHVNCNFSEKNITTIKRTRKYSIEEKIIC